MARWSDHPNVDGQTAERARGLGRRELLTLLAWAGVGLAAGPLVRPARAGWTIRVDTWGGPEVDAMRRHAFVPFEERQGIKVIVEKIKNQESFFQKVAESFKGEHPTGEFSLAQLSGLFEYAKYVRHGFHLPLDLDRIPNIKYVMPATIEGYREITPDGLAGVPYNLGLTGIAYNTRHVSPEEASKKGVELLWDQAYQGKQGGAPDWITNIWYAALYDGQDPNDIRKIKKVYKALAKRHPLVARYWESGAELEKLLAGGEIWVTPAWSGRVANLRAKGLPIGFLTPPRTYAWNECIFAIRGANCGAASVLINRLIQPETAIAVAQAMKYPPSLDPTKVQMPEAIQKLPGFDPTGRLEGLTFADPVHWQRNEAAWSAAFAKIKAGQPVG